MTWVVILAALDFVKTSIAQAPPDEVVAQFRRIETNLAAATAVPRQVQEDLADLEANYADMARRLAAAETEAARSYTRVASHIGATLRRELKKVHPSLRLIEITRKTGRTAEIEQYQQRRRVLMEMIDLIASEYERTIRDLCGLRPELVRAGFAEYEQRLVARELPEQIQINHQVRQHYEGCCAAGTADVETWKKELNDL